MARLTDVYYTSETLDGVPEPEAHGVPLQFYQGEDIVFDVYLNYNEKPVLVDEWTITAIVKRNAYAILPVVLAELNHGIYKNDAQGYYKIIVPSDVSSLLIAGTYWLDVVITEKNGKGIKDITKVIVRQPFAVDYSAASPNPGKTLQLSNLEQSWPEIRLADRI